MFKTPEGYNYVDLDTMPAPEYLIKPGDKITFKAYTNMGLTQIQTNISAFEGGGGSGGMQQQQSGYTVRSTGVVQLPITGEVNLSGMTIPQAEAFLMERVSKLYEDPMIVLEVVNRKAYVYTGGSEAASVVQLEEENLTLIEVLTMAGGINQDGKAYRVKVIRGDLDEPMIALYDLSTVESMQKASLIIQPEDIIYVEPTTRFASGLLREISPYLGLIGSITSLVSIFLIYSRTSNGN